MQDPDHAVQPKKCTHTHFTQYFRCEHWTQSESSLWFPDFLHRLSYAGVIDPWVGGLYSVHLTKRSLVLLKGPKGWISACIVTGEIGKKHYSDAPLEPSSTFFALFGNSVYSGEQAHLVHLGLLRALQMTQHSCQVLL